MALRFRLLSPKHSPRLSLRVAAIVVILHSIVISAFGEQCSALFLATSLTCYCRTFLDVKRQVGTYLAACVLQQVDPLTLVEIDADADGKSGRGSYTRDSHPNASGESAATAAASVPLDDGAVSATTPCSTPPPIFELPRCVSGKLPGNLVYARAVLPPMPTRLKKSKRPSEDAGADADPDTRQSASSSVAQEGSRAVKSFTTGAVLTGVGSETGEGSAASGGEGGGGYCVVRVDSLDSVCDVIYCGHQPVEAKNLSKIVGVQLGYLQAS